MLYSSFGHIMNDSPISRPSTLHPLMQHRSTTDLLPRSRGQAMRARRSAARSKLNLIARQLYDLKYDQEWQQAQLQQLTHRSHSLELQAQEGIRRLQEAQAMAAGLVELQLGTVGKEGGLGSERSTEPEREQEREGGDGEAGGESSVGCQSGTGLHNAEQTSAPTQNSLTASQSSLSASRRSLSPNKPRQLSASKQIAQKKGISKSGMRSLPIGNIVLFTLLLFVVLILL